MRTLASLALFYMVMIAACQDTPPPAAATSRPSLSPEGDRALTLLLSAKRFTDDAIGEGGDTPDEVLAVRTLWKERDPGAAFAHLAAHATTLPGRLFGLCGLWYTDPAAFVAAAAPLRDLETTVPIQMGCEGGDMPVREIVDRKEKAVRLASREQSIQEWFATRPGGASAYYDIAGGGYPCLFRTGGGF